METKNYPLETLCAALCYAIGIELPKEAAKPNELLTKLTDDAFKGEKADRIVMYNPDAIARWIAEKYAYLIDKVTNDIDISIPFETVMPSVTPVCFGTMYTGASPAVHGIRKYEKPVIAIDTIFDALIRAGKKCAIVASDGCSLSRIYNEKEMDYFYTDGITSTNVKAFELIDRDEYDFLVIYNGNYDSVMHKNGPESIAALSELRTNAETFATIRKMIAEKWQHHNTLLGFAMDHGCHEIDGNCGSHGLDMPEDLFITHYYKAFKRQ